jgi:hypothetical protein
MYFSLCINLVRNLIHTGKGFHNVDKLTGIPHINSQYAGLEHFILENDDILLTFDCQPLN